jgi:hypothetical protein
MKKINVVLATLIALISFNSCEKDAVQIIDDKTIGAQIKFYNFSIGAPGVNFYANDAKITAVASATGTESVSGVAYGSVGPLNNYANIAPGTYAFSGRISATTDKDLVIGTVTATLEDKKFYSLYLSGPYNTTTKKTDGFVIEDRLPEIDLGVAYVRFVNGISNANAMDFYVKNTTTLQEAKLGSAVAYKSGSDFVVVQEGVYDLSARNVGATATAIPRTAVSFVRGRVYTISSRGDITISTAGTAVNRPFLDNTINR